jgi:hypothetical protein
MLLREDALIGEGIWRTLNRRVPAQPAPKVRDYANDSAEQSHELAKGAKLWRKGANHPNG